MFYFGYCAEDTTFHTCDSDIGNYRILVNDSVLATEWFESNYKKLGENKFYFLMCGYKQEMFPDTGQSRVWESQNKIAGLKLLSVFKATNYHDVVVVWCPGVMVFTNAGLQLPKPELGF